MKHRHGNRIFGLVAAKRQRLMTDLSLALLEHGAITITSAKAKELRKFFEPLVTKAKGEMTLHTRRRLLRVLPKESLARLEVVAKAQADRPGGYLRITRVPSARQDASQMARIEII